ncbi:MAG: hypothetical protein CVV51_08350 [Spirochaetae bacterium HGW-Spirochaetae-7]|jgi:hypothetical protein|nr:MAG: hypothetical protein CVV51_08350 [Spirochaetae bacterium HGW-Spirochaetae-7]
MTENIVGVLIGGGIGLLSTLITLVVTGYNDRTRRRLKYKERQAVRIAKTTIALYDVENLLLDRLVALNEGAKPTLKTQYRNQVAGDGASTRMVRRSEINRLLEFSNEETPNEEES